MSQHITNADIIAANRNAIKTGTLGAMRGLESCEYRYDDGSRCGIGACFTDETLRLVLDRQQNELPADFLDRDIVTFEDADAVFVTQVLHDYWASESVIRFLSCQYADFINQFYGQPATREIYEAWLTYLENLPCN